MGRSILATLNAIKDKPLEALSQKSIDRTCAAAGHDWRDGPLNPASTMGLFLEQVARGNVPCSEVRHIAAAGGGREGVGPKDPPRQFTASAYCQARQRLPLEVIKRLARGVCEELTAETGAAKATCGDAEPGAAAAENDHLWRGHRTFHVDGSSFSMPDTPDLQKHFGQHRAQKEGCGFPIAHLLTLFDARTGLIHDAIAAPLRTHEMSQVSKTHAHLRAGDLVIGDDSFGTWAHFALLMQGGMHGLFPAHHKRIVDFTPDRPHTSLKSPDKGVAQFKVAQEHRGAGPAGGVVQAAQPAQVDDGRAVRRPARFDRGAGGAAYALPQGFSPHHAHLRHHAVGPGGISRGGAV